MVGPTRPAGPGWENGWPLGPPDACCPAARATADPGGVPEGRRRSRTATTPGDAPPQDTSTPKRVPEGAAQPHRPRSSTSTTPPASRCGPARPGGWHDEHQNHEPPPTKIDSRQPFRRPNLASIYALFRLTTLGVSRSPRHPIPLEMKAPAGFLG